MSWIDKFFAGIQAVAYNAAALVSRPTLNFKGSGVSVADNPTTNQTDVTIAGGGSGGGGYATLESSGTALPQQTTLNILGATLTDNSGSSRTDMAITMDSILPAFTPTLALSTGSSGPLVPGATWTPTFASTPAYNATGVTAATCADNQGHSGVTISSNPFQGPEASYSLSANGTISVNATITKSGVTKTTNNVSVTFADRTFQGVGGAGATASTASGTNATLSGGSAGGTTLTGTAPTPNPVGQSFTVSPAGQKVYDQVIHTSTPHTYTNGVIPFGMNAPTTITFVNENGVSESWDLYESTNTLTGTFTITRAT